MTEPSAELYEVVFAALIAAQPSALPEEARRELGARLRELAVDPWASSQRYHPRMPEEMRSASFGAWGVVVFVISEKRRRVIVSNITWV